MTTTGTQLRLSVVRYRRARRSAFTLLELVVSLMMVAVLVVPLYSSMKTAFKAQQSAEAAVEPARTVELAMDLIRTDIQSAVLPNPNAASLRVLAGPFYGNPGTDDRGHNNDDVVFCTTAEGPKPVDASQPDPLAARQQDISVPYGDIRQVELNIVTAPNGDHVLLRRVTSNLLADVQIDPDDEVLCRGVSAFAVRYFNGTDWATSWDSESDNTLPTAVEVTIELERPGGMVQNSQGAPVMRYIRVFQLPCSTANPDTSQAQ